MFLDLERKITKIIRYWKYLGIAACLGHVFYKIFPRTWNSFRRFMFYDYAYPMHIRYGARDYDLFYRIFMDKEYSCVEKLRPPKFVIDCGANVGFSSIYLFYEFPEATILAVEPEQDNLMFCMRNLELYRRIYVRHAAVWSHAVNLKFNDTGRSLQMREVKEGEEYDFVGTNIYSLLEESGFGFIDLLKLNINHIEKIIFTQNYERWLNRTRNIVIELSDVESLRIFFEAMKDYRYEVFTSGKLTICKNIRRKKDAGKKTS